MMIIMLFLIFMPLAGSQDNRRKDLFHDSDRQNINARLNYMENDVYRKIAAITKEIEVFNTITNKHENRLNNKKAVIKSLFERNRERAEEIVSVNKKIALINRDMEHFDKKLANIDTCQQQFNNGSCPANNKLYKLGRCINTVK